MFVFQAGLVENMSKIIKEYKEVKRLLPIFVCILGPPAVGKTFIIRQLSQHYKLHHVKIADVIKEAIENNVSANSSNEHFAGKPTKIPLNDFDHS